MVAGSDHMRQVGDVQRIAHVDALRFALTCAVIIAHCAITYGADGSWFYRETGASDALRAALDVPLAAGSLFGMGLFFFLAGCFVPASLMHKGLGHFLGDRWLRLGVPVVVMVAIIVPLVQWTVGWATGVDPPAGEVWLDQVRSLDAGPLWFAGVLLLFSTAYAVGAAARPARTLRLDPAVLAGAMGCVAAFTFLLRLEFPVGSEQTGSAHVWQWGQCLVLFLLGVTGGREAVTTGLTVGVHRTCVAGVTTGASLLVLLLAGLHDNLDPLGGGWTVPAALFAAAEGMTSVGAALLVVDRVRRSHDRHFPRGRLVRATYGAFMLQTPVLVTAALAMRPLPLPAGIKLIVIASSAVPVCFALAAGARKIPALRRIL